MTMHKMRRIRVITSATPQADPTPAYSGVKEFRATFSWEKIQCIHNDAEINHHTPNVVVMVDLLLSAVGGGVDDVGAVVAVGVITSVTVEVGCTAISEPSQDFASVSLLQWFTEHIYYYNLVFANVAI